MIKIFLVKGRDFTLTEEGVLIEQTDLITEPDELTPEELKLLKSWGFVHINSYPKRKTKNISDMTWEVIKSIKIEDKQLLKKFKVLEK